MFGKLRPEESSNVDPAQKNQSYCTGCCKGKDQCNWMFMQKRHFKPTFADWAGTVPKRPVNKWQNHNHNHNNNNNHNNNHNNYNNNVLNQINNNNNNNNYNSGTTDWTGYSG